ncbi:1314_t:CDS:10 [Funneliformis caledonium]|uniref:1314_t:CDS:1 n=1 Tax=Funneliformis caledonium TaxID=1117310 RepID=A0A9N9A2A4_9GLOM|nr:1314_t:CDS:10 [Funneliformis caledonium]
MSEFIFGAEISKSIEITKTAFKASGTVEEAIKPYLQLIAVVTTLIDDIIKIYDGVESNNKKICSFLMDRVYIAEIFIKILSRRKQENEKNFRNMKYYLTFARFTNVMKEIRDFIKDVSKLQFYKKFYEFNGLVSDFESVMKDLNFTDKEQRRIDQLALTEDSSEMAKAALEAEEIIETEGDVNERTKTMGNQGTDKTAETMGSERVVDTQRTEVAVEVVSTDVTVETMRTQRTDCVVGVVGTEANVDTIRTEGTEGAMENQRTLETVGALGEAIKPYIPYIAIVTTIIDKIFSIYEDIEYNKKICNALMDRVQIVDYILKRRKWKENLLRNKEYYLAFIKLIEIMRRIKNFIIDVSQLKGYNKFLHSSIKDTFNDLVYDFDIIIDVLNFTTTIDNGEQRKIDRKALDEDIVEMSRFLERIEGGITTGNNQINLDVILINNQIKEIIDMNRWKAVEIIKTKEIEPNELSDSREKRKHYPIRKFLKQSIDVACIRNDNLSSRIVILELLSYSPNVLKFYGLSYVENHQVMVFEWAEHGNLREVYNTYEISWVAKVSIALGICRGIIFLHSCSVLHRELRCESIMMTSRLEPKIANLEYSRPVDDNTTCLSNMTEIMHWLAPENMRNYRYNMKCDIFSFGMLLWELIFQKIPYEHWDFYQIKEHVLSNKREKITFGGENPDIQNLQKSYAKIIVSAWQDDPQIRASLQQIFLNLHDLYTTHCSSGYNSSLALKPLDLDGSKAVSVSDIGGLDLPDFDMEFSISAVQEIMSLEEGIKAYRRSDYATAWECFNAHAELGNTKAKYWKGYYLWENSSDQKDQEEASKLFKAAADDGFADAQLRYAFSLIENNGINLPVFIEYLTKSADNNNNTAQFNLGDLYINGKFGVTKNTIKTTTIEPHELTDPLGDKPTDCGIVKKSIKFSVDVAYTPTIIQDDDFMKTIAHFTMLEKLRYSDNILKFYGLSHIDDQLVTIFEWAELRNLCDVYNIYDISWTTKVSIALGICRGIIFLHSCSILHHDIRCANIMITARLEPKITNFKCAHIMFDGVSKPKKTFYESIPNLDDVINWMAPEKIKYFKLHRYDVKCEAFSFGMLMWELAFEKVPYKGWNVHKIKNHVLNKYRETLESRSNNDESFQEKYFEIIKNNWHHDSRERSSFPTIFNELNELIGSYQQNGFSQSLVPKNIYISQAESVDELENKAKEWIEDSIKRKVIKSIAWSEFNSHKMLSAGNFGSVHQAYWSKTHKHVAYKTLFITPDIKYKMWEAFRHEIQLQKNLSTLLLPDTIDSLTLSPASASSSSLVSSTLSSESTVISSRTCIDDSLMININPSDWAEEENS